MKRLMSLLFCVISIYTSFAQAKTDASKHLSFKGVPIDGTLAEYVAKMKQQGFTYKGTKDGIALLEGEFASYNNCTIGVSTLTQKDLVCKVVIIFPERHTWSSLITNYNSIKELLTEKYGNPSGAVEEFQSYTPDSDGSKMTQVQLGACNYYTTYETEKGTIQLSIERDRLIRCFVKLIYVDKINGETVRKQALDDL
ncbi:hypothetical protein CAP35_13200 [Chitinophagaceae bacterium IBVUCB1]|nr:hypothetical protein CAP35_13200 [Chitinophagaceae bacterium IBVUCB1]